MKQNYVIITKTIDDNNVQHSSLDTENEFLNPIWMWDQNNTRYKFIQGQKDSLDLKTPKVYDNHRQTDRD